MTAPASIAAELARALRTPPARSRLYAEFQARYCHLEDGHATDRLLARLGLDRVGEVVRRPRRGGR